LFAPLRVVCECSGCDVGGRLAAGYIIVTLLLIVITTVADPFIDRHYDYVLGSVAATLFSTDTFLTDGFIDGVFCVTFVF